MKRFAINWTDSSELKGGCEIIFDMVKYLLNSELLTATGIMQVYNIQRDPTYYRYAIYDRVHFIWDFINDLDTIDKSGKIFIANDCCCPLGIEDKGILISYAQNPYIDVCSILAEMGFYSKPAQYEFGIMYPNLQFEQFRKSDYIVACSDFMKEYITSRIDAKVKVIPHGVNTTMFIPKNKDNLRDKYNIPKDKKVGIWVGAFHPLKGFHFVRELIKSKENMHWILVFKHELKEAPKASNVTYFENIGQDVLAELYNCADFLIMPSSVESFNLVACEAMSCGVPAIITNTGFAFRKGNKGRNMRKEDFGIVVEISDSFIEDLSTAVDDVISWKFNPRNFIIEKDFTIEGWKKRWDDFLSEVEKKQ